MKSLLSLFFFIVLKTTITFAQTGPVRIGVAGLSHDHVHGILGRAARGDIQVVGIAEANTELAARYVKRYGLDPKLIFPSLEEMIVATKPEVVCAFGPINEHLRIVQWCAPKGIHVMVEKPLAVSLDHAREMIALSKKYNTFLLTNYETSWYASNHRAFEILNGQRAIGELRKVVVHDGHPGPKEIGISNEFFSWLTDPEKNGGGAIMDFGCYGADLITWLMKGERPTAVLAVTQHFKPDTYPRVDDEATIILTYPRAQGIIQASWNWPVSRKDMEVYGQHGYVLCDNRSDVRIRYHEGEAEIKEKLDPRAAPYDDPFSFLAAVVRKTIPLPAQELSSPEINAVAMEILEAARESARTGKVVNLH